MIRSVLVLAKMDRPSPMYLIMEEGKSLVLVGWRESVLNYLKLVGVPGFVVCIVHISVLHRAMLTLNVLIRFPCCFRCRCFTSVQCFSLVLFDSRLSTPIHAHSFWLPVTLELCRLVKPMDVVYECGAGCGCGPECINRTSQQGLQFRLEVIHSPLVSSSTANFLLFSLLVSSRQVVGSSNKILVPMLSRWWIE